MLLFRLREDVKLTELGIKTINQMFDELIQPEKK